MKLATKLLGGLAAGALALSGAAPAGAATLYPTPTPTPTDCHGALLTMEPNRNLGAVFLSGGKLRWEHTNWSSPVPFDATYLTQLGGYGDETFGKFTYFGTAADGTAKFYDERTDLQVDGSWKRSIDGPVTTIGNGWFQKSITTTYSGSVSGSTVVRGQQFVFRLTSGGELYRYTIDPHARTITGTVKVFGGGASITSIGSAPAVAINGKPVAVLMATLSTGELRQYLIPDATPTLWTHKTIRPAASNGWQNFTAITARKCDTKGQIVLGYIKQRLVAAYYDPTGLTANDKDISGGASSMPVMPEGIRVFG
ncbi:hypothetical protein BIU82_08355 [Arthrobacter sp. SW1]|uniref:hypothetical protein n=1 Tax=Arthrobacter sp. SW1 TaxID=1920889 RepID=UPI000877B45B|nr:hypothetical protein [Arthrobacter sp. SW1]OFI37111.1 hypothetical protein BIU82_08355 [Arthrobacter sp. SW1]